MGGFDVFRSTWNESTQSWNQPEHLGEPINSVADDIFYKVDHATQTAHFTSNRKGGQGKTDIYQVVEYTNERRGKYTNDQVVKLSNEEKIETTQLAKNH